MSLTRLSFRRTPLFPYLCTDLLTSRSPPVLFSLKIRILPLPPLLSAFNRLFSIFSTPLPSSLESSVSSPPRTALDNLVAASKVFYAKKDSKGISVYRWEQYNECWRGKVTRGKKSVESVILPVGIGMELLRDVKDFLGRKKW